MRVPYAPSKAPKHDEETAAIYDRITERRAPRPLLPLDLALLQSPPVADGYNAFVGALRSKTTVPPRLLELAICRIAVLNSAVFEWNSHAPLALHAGLARTVLQRAHDATEQEVAARSMPGLRQDEHAVLRYTDEMTKKVAVQETTFKEMKRHLGSDREMVELTSVIAGYNCVSRFLVALDVGENNDKKMKDVSEVEAELKRK